jgi:cytoskeletal protein CcmA (bactofilin family)
MPKNNEVTTRIAPGAELRGKVSGSEDLSVGGRLEGALHLEGTLIVEPEGIVKADVLVARAVIAGIVVGNVEATESIHIDAGGRVKGDLHAPRISIVEGARFAGTIDMGEVAARPVEEARTMIERPRTAPVARPPVVRTPPPAQKPIVFEGAVPARPSVSGETAYVAPVASTRPGDARRKRIVVKKRS